jgi:phenylpropionate dioxygenase-like ring-hydroxylating dioxygenase large terminal subunit
MRPDVESQVLNRLLAAISRKDAEAGTEASTVEVERYVDMSRFEREKLLLRSIPVAVAREEDVPNAGDFVTCDIAGAPMLVARGNDDRLRAFFNVCRHRGAIVESQSRGHAKAFTCRYHAWSYALEGNLVHVPLVELFPTLNKADCGLVELGCMARHGFVWVKGRPGPVPDMQSIWGRFDDDMEAFELASHQRLFQSNVVRACNWKLVLEAFMEGYHAKALHRTTLARFFLEAAVFDFDRLSIRQAGARKTILDSSDSSAARLRDVATIFYLLFPNTILVFHPDWVSHMTVWPIDVDHSRIEHSMLVARKPTDEKALAHLEKSFRLIDGEVFQKEDYAIAESVQRGLLSGANTVVQLGRLEQPIRYFHDALDRAVRACW